MSVSELSRNNNGRPAATAAPGGRKPGIFAAVRGLGARMLSWPGKLVSSGFVRAVLIFVAGFAAALAWDTWGHGMRRAVAGWSPRLSWVAPASTGTAAERIKATNVALATVRQSVDKLGSEINRLQAEEDRSNRQPDEGSKRKRR
jgi:hypothetical protein